MKFREEQADNPIRSRFENLPPEWHPPDPASPRGRILAAARSLFAEHGLAETSTRAIAEKAEVNLAMIHYYFGTKVNLYDRVLAFEFLALVRCLSHSLAPEQPAHEILVSIPRQVSSVLHENRTWTRLLRHEIAAGGQRISRALRALGGIGPLGLRQFFGGLFERAVAEGKIRALPMDAVRECILTLAWGSAFLQPFFLEMFDRDLDDEATWKEWQDTMDTLIRHGLFTEGKP